MKRVNLRAPSRETNQLADPALPVNAIDAPVNYGQYSVPAAQVAKPRLLARRNARLARRETH